MIMQRPSPNHGPRADDGVVDMLILHYTGMQSASAALERLCDPQARVSAHYMIGEDGAIWQLVSEERRAWHAGLAYWAGETDVNGRSIGIELVNPGHEFGYRSFPDAQMAALEALAKGILDRHPIPMHRVLGHSDVAPDRKRDPGELFDWSRLAGAGIGLWPGVEDVAAGTQGQPNPARIRTLLAKFGYRTGEPGEPDDVTRLAIEAFQRHFRPGRIDGRADAECIALLTSLCAHMA